MFETIFVICWRSVGGIPLPALTLSLAPLLDCPMGVDIFKVGRLFNLLDVGRDGLIEREEFNGPTGTKQP